MKESIFTAVFHKEEDMYVAFCPELDIASQGDSIEKAKLNLKEAISLFMETASDEEKGRRIKSDIFVTTISS